MSFLTEYFDEYRAHPLRKTVMCRPEERYAKLDGIWLDPKKDQDKAMSDEEIKQFIRRTMRNLRGQSTYYNEYCAHHPPEMKERRPINRPKRDPCKSINDAEEEVAAPAPTVKLAMKDTELMKVAESLYQRDLDAPTLKPLMTHGRILGYVRPSLYHTGLSDYQDGIARLAYELIRDDRIPRYQAHNGGRPRWGLPPEGTRQPELDAAPYDGESLY